MAVSLYGRESASPAAPKCDEDVCLSEPLLGAQVTEISRYFEPWEITSVCADFFKLMVILA
jgi:hypothetical protein